MTLGGVSTNTDGQVLDVDGAVIPGLYAAGECVGGFWGRFVSGGKGANEPFPEAQGMADYLKAHGIEEGRILQESKSKTTQENIVNSKKLIAGDNASVGIITTDFHMFRALQIAHDNGLDEAQGIAAGSPPDMLVNNMVREFFAEIKFLLS